MFVCKGPFLGVKYEERNVTRSNKWDLFILRRDIVYPVSWWILILDTEKEEKKNSSINDYRNQIVLTNGEFCWSN